MKSKAKIGPFILKLVVLTIALGLGGFCLLMLRALIQEFVMALLIACILIGFISVTMIHLVINQLKTLTVDIQRKTITIKYLGLVERHLTIDKLKGYNKWPFSNTFGKQQGTLIELIDGRQVHITEFDTSNYIELRNALTSFITRDMQIRPRIWTTFNKLALTFGIILILFMLTVKAVESATAHNNGYKTYAVA